MKRIELIIVGCLFAAFIVLAVCRQKIISDVPSQTVGSQENSSESMPDLESSESEGEASESSAVGVWPQTSVTEHDPENGIQGGFTTRDISYLDDAVFIGDSRTQGLQLGTGLSTPRFLAERGLSVDKVDEEAIFQLSDGSNGTIYDVLDERSYGKIYLMFGVNELGWVYSETFIEYFRDIIQEIQDLQPGSVIYVQGILPVTASKSSEGDVYTNDKVHEWNPLIEQMAHEEGCVYLNPGEALCDETGALPEEAAVDGVHLTPEYCQKWLDYLLTHTAASEAAWQ